MRSFRYFFLLTKLQVTCLIIRNLLFGGEIGLGGGYVCILKLHYYSLNLPVTMC
jgi:hypothetical protein